jgi:hypothetical protein
LGCQWSNPCVIHTKVGGGEYRERTLGRSLKQDKRSGGVPNTDKNPSRVVGIVLFVALWLVMPVHAN